MKLYLADIESRVLLKENQSYGIINFDIDNAYAQRTRELINSSGTAWQCVDRYSRFIEGEGFANTVFYKASVSDKKLTMDKLLRKIAVDYAYHRGFAVHVNYNALYQPIELKYIPFQDCRLPLESNDDHKGMICVYDDWGKRKKRSINTKDLQWYHRYNPDPGVIEREVTAAGGWHAYGGQVFWYSADGENEYPLSPADPVLEDIDTDAQIKTFRNNSVRSGFLDHLLFTQIGKFDSETERHDFKKDLREFQGAKNSTKVFFAEVDSKEEIPDVKAFPSTEPDKKFEQTTRTTKDAIIEGFGIPPVLLNALVPGKLGTATEIQDAVRFYNKQTSRERILMEETARELCGNMPGVAPADGNYSINEFTW